MESQQSVFRSLSLRFCPAFYFDECEQYFPSTLDYLLVNTNMNMNTNINAHIDAHVEKNENALVQLFPHGVADIENDNEHFPNKSKLSLAHPAIKFGFLHDLHHAPIYVQHTKLGKTDSHHMLTYHLFFPCSPVVGCWETWMSQDTYADVKSVRLEVINETVNKVWINRGSLTDTQWELQNWFDFESDFSHVRIYCSLNTHQLSTVDRDSYGSWFWWCCGLDNLEQNYTRKWQPQHTEPLWSVKNWHRVSRLFCQMQ